MGCIIAILGFFLPRLTIIILVLAGDYIGRAYQTTLWPLLGFFFMPYTTLAYAFTKNTNGSVDGWYWVLMVLAVLLDFGVFSESDRQRKERKRRERIKPPE